jgi:adenylosuccinate synthase
MFRHNGGAQAGHTIKHNGSRVVNQSLNSATINGQFFTGYTPDVVVNINEIVNESAQHTNNPFVGMTAENEWSTYLDIAFNQVMSKAQNSNGTCGFGINATLRRAEHIQFNYRNVVFGMDALKKMSEIRDYYADLFYKNNVEAHLYHHLISIEYVRNALRHMMGAANTFQSGGRPFVEVYEWADELSEVDSIIFEGAQGLLLDQSYGEFPFVTPSNTGLTNAVAFTKKNQNGAEIIPVYCTRTFATRHGDGPFSEDNPFVSDYNVVDGTNVTNQYQGRFKTGILDIDKMTEVIDLDMQNAKLQYGHVNTPIISVSHLDVFDSTKVRIKKNGCVIEVDHDGFINAMPYPVRIMGYGEDSQDWVSLLGE